MNVGPPGDPGDQPDESPYVDQKLDKLAAYLHLEWCVTCGDWRPLGHVAADHPDTSGKAGAIQARLESEMYPTIG